jgi:methionyl-tRNA synthetase
MKVKLRVARIESAEAVPKSNKMLRLQLDLGPLGKRQILSGIAKFYTPEALIGKHIVVVANLKPAKLMGLESAGMLLAASSDDGSALCVLEPTDIPPGSVVR